MASAAGEDLRTEVATQVTTAEVTTQLDAAGLPGAECWTDPDGDSALTLATPHQPPAGPASPLPPRVPAPSRRAGWPS